MRRITVILAALLPVLGLACLEAGDFEPYPCNAFNECPGDLICLDGLCRTTWPQGVFGDLCQSPADCEAPYGDCQVKTFSVTGLCTKGCGNRWDCPKGARCIQLDDGPMCMPACDSNSDCDAMLFCLYRNEWGGNSYCYPLGPAYGAGLLEDCEHQPCRDELQCMVEEYTQVPVCLHLCKPKEYGIWNAPSCRYRGTNGACDWVVTDPDATKFGNIGYACSPLCDTSVARDACGESPWECYLPSYDDSPCWPPGREP